MPIETICQCGKRLRVADQHAGKLAKCPQCQAVYTVPQPAALGAGPASSGPFPTDDRWHLRTDGGLTFGPVSRVDLDRWMAEGRIGHASQILHEGHGDWNWAGTVYPHLAALSVAGPSAPLPAGGGVFSPPSDNPYSPPTSFNAHYPGHVYREQHRGGLVLALGLIGFLVCPLTGIPAVILGIADLGKMKQGVMDPAGRAMTIAGLVLGCLSLLYLAFWALIAAAMILGSM